MTMVFTRRVSGLGITLSPEVMRMAMMRPITATSIVQNVPPVDSMSEECACKARELASALGTDDAALINQLAVACTASPQMMDEAARAAGVNLDPCKPWYLRKSTWLVGGLVAAAGVAVVLVRR